MVSFDIYKILCMKFSPKIQKYYIQLENLFMNQIEIYEKESQTMRDLIKSFSKEVEEREKKIKELAKEVQ